MNNYNNMLTFCCLGYNHASFIRNNIEAIWKSGYKNIEIIVVDDGSKDDSAKILEELQKISPYPMKIILQENTGNIGFNFNRALKIANGEFVLMMSLDDVICSNQIEKCINRLINNKNLAFIASSKVSAIDDNNKHISSVPALKLDTMINPNADDLLELEYNDFGAFYIQGCFFRKDIVANVGYFDEDMIGDDIVLRTKIFRYIKNTPNYSFEILKEPICYYRRHDNNVSNNSTRQMKIVGQYLQRYWTNRETPEIFALWMMHTIKYLTFKESLNLFAFNEKTASLLKDEKIQKQLIHKVKMENGWLRFIYKKEKIENKRVITLFHCFKFSFTTKTASRLVSVLQRVKRIFR